MIFIEVAGAIIAVVLGIFGIILTIQHQQKKATHKLILTQLSQHGDIMHHGNKILFQTQRDAYEVLFFYVPFHGELTINSRTIWEVRTGSGSQLIDQSIFLASSYPKLVIIYPTTLVVKRYINENELVFINYQNRFYDLQIVRSFEVQELMDKDIL